MLLLVSLCHHHTLPLMRCKSFQNTVTTYMSKLWDVWWTKQMYFWPLCTFRSLLVSAWCRGQLCIMWTQRPELRARTPEFLSPVSIWWTLWLSNSLKIMEKMFPTAWGYILRYLAHKRQRHKTENLILIRTKSKLHEQLSSFKLALFFSLFSHLIIHFFCCRMCWVITLLLHRDQ